jgi:beta-lactamase regulating signal transducer with metallopeptidase domain
MTLIVSWLWQGVAVAWITAAAVRAMPRLNATTRHAIWWLALGAVLAIPAAQGLATIAPGTPPAPDLAGSLDADAAGALMLPALPDGVVAVAAALWAIAAVMGLLQIVRSCRALGRLKRASLPFDREREARLPLWAAARDVAPRGHRSAELRTSDRMTGACALGLRRPVIVVSRTVADALDDEALDEIVMHEQAHLDRFDDWLQLLQAVVCSIAGLHPAVRFLARRLEIDREAACDDRVVSRTRAARRYASSLLAVAAASNPEAGGAEFAGVPAATTTASALRVRVSRLLDPGRDHDRRLAGATSLVTATALALTVVMSTQVGPVVVFLEATGIHVPSAPAAPAILARSAPEPAARAIANANAAAVAAKRPSRRTIAKLERPAQSEPSAVAARPVARPTPEATPTALLDSRIVAVNGDASVPVSLPSIQPAAIAPTQAGAPWEAVTTSATSAAEDVTRAAVTTGVRARSAGVAISRFVTRASKASASVF